MTQDTAQAQAAQDFSVGPRLNTSTPEDFVAAVRTALEWDRKHAMDKHFWLDVAEQLGPELTQEFYHAAVFCTRVTK